MTTQSNGPVAAVPMTEEQKFTAAKPYAYLIWPHRVLLGLGALAIVSFAVFLKSWSSFSCPI